MSHPTTPPSGKVTAGQFDAQASQKAANPPQSDLMAQFAKLVRRGKPKEAVDLLAASEGGVDTLDCDGRTALHWCSGNGFVEASRYLIQAKANVSQADNSGNTPAHVAYTQRHGEVLQVLLAAGANIVHLHTQPAEPRAPGGRPPPVGVVRTSSPVRTPSPGQSGHSSATLTPAADTSASYARSVSPSQRSQHSERSTHSEQCERSSRSRRSKRSVRTEKELRREQEKRKYQASRAARKALRERYLHGDGLNLNLSDSQGLLNQSQPSVEQSLQRTEAPSQRYQSFQRTFNDRHRHHEMFRGERDGQPISNDVATDIVVGQVTSDSDPQQQQLQQQQLNVSSHNLHSSHSSRSSSHSERRSSDQHVSLQVSASMDMSTVEQTYVAMQEEEPQAAQQPSHQSSNENETELLSDLALDPQPDEHPQPVPTAAETLFIPVVVPQAIEPSDDAQAVAGSQLSSESRSVYSSLEEVPMEQLVQTAAPDDQHDHTEAQQDEGNDRHLTVLSASYLPQLSPRTVLTDEVALKLLRAQLQAQIFAKRALLDALEVQVTQQPSDTHLEAELQNQTLQLRVLEQRLSTADTARSVSPDSPAHHILQTALNTCTLPDAGVFADHSESTSHITLSLERLLRNLRGQLSAKSSDDNDFELLRRQMVAVEGALRATLTPTPLVPVTVDSPLQISLDSPQQSAQLSQQQEPETDEQQTTQPSGDVTASEDFADTKSASHYVDTKSAAPPACQSAEDLLADIAHVLSDMSSASIDQLLSLQQLTLAAINSCTDRLRLLANPSPAELARQRSEVDSLEQLLAATAATRSQPHMEDRDAIVQLESQLQTDLAVAQQALQESFDSAERRAKVVSESRLLHQALAKLSIALATVPYADADSQVATVAMNPISSAAAVAPQQDADEEVLPASPGSSSARDLALSSFVIREVDRVVAEALYAEHNATTVSTTSAGSAGSHSRQSLPAAAAAAEAEAEAAVAEDLQQSVISEVSTDDMTELIESYERMTAAREEFFNNQQRLRDQLLSTSVSSKATNDAIPVTENAHETSIGSIASTTTFSERVEHFPAQSAARQTYTPRTPRSITPRSIRSVTPTRVMDAVYDLTSVRLEPPREVAERARRSVSPASRRRAASPVTAAAVTPARPTVTVPHHAPVFSSIYSPIVPTLRTKTPPRHMTSEPRRAVPMRASHDVGSPSASRPVNTTASSSPLVSAMYAMSNGVDEERRHVRASALAAGSRGGPYGSTNRTSPQRARSTGRAVAVRSASPVHVVTEAKQIEQDDAAAVRRTSMSGEQRRSSTPEVVKRQPFPVRQVVLPRRESFRVTEFYHPNAEQREESAQMERQQLSALRTRHSIIYSDPSSMPEPLPTPKSRSPARDEVADIGLRSKSPSLNRSLSSARSVGSATGSDSTTTSDVSMMSRRRSSVAADLAQIAAARKLSLPSDQASDALLQSAQSLAEAQWLSSATGLAFN
eukprot:TRINITY_DN10215_c0_g1_i1.p1 TRINITY_DN10215_c0_g1~~TRINITY_DN10215_c0_g1_i1.p1  ORF type:complete len:1469 (-),score=393.13 TRINITY_DN10215_c0_g1_i1:1236-5642(-)